MVWRWESGNTVGIIYMMKLSNKKKKKSVKDVLHLLKQYTNLQTYSEYNNLEYFIANLGNTGHVPSCETCCICSYFLVLGSHAAFGGSYTDAINSENKIIKKKKVWSFNSEVCLKLLHDYVKIYCLPLFWKVSGPQQHRVFWWDNFEATCAFTHKFSYQPADSSPPPVWKCCRLTGKRNWSGGNCAASMSTTEQRNQVLQWPFLLENPPRYLQHVSL